MQCNVCRKIRDSGEEYTLYYGTKERVLAVDCTENKIYNVIYSLKEEKGIVCDNCLSCFFNNLNKKIFLSSLIPAAFFSLFIFGIQAESDIPFSIFNPVNIIILISLIPFVLFGLIYIIQRPKLQKQDKKTIRWMANYYYRDWLHKNQVDYDTCAWRLRIEDLKKQGYNQVFTSKRFEQLKQNGKEINLT